MEWTCVKEGWPDRGTAQGRDGTGPPPLQRQSRDAALAVGDSGRAATAAPSTPIRIFSIAYPDHYDKQLCVVDLIENPVVTDADSITAIR